MRDGPPPLPWGRARGAAWPPVVPMAAFRCVPCALVWRSPSTAIANVPRPGLSSDHVAAYFHTHHVAVGSLLLGACATDQAPPSAPVRELPRVEAPAPATVARPAPIKAPRVERLPPVVQQPVFRESTAPPTSAPPPRVETPARPRLSDVELIGRYLRTRARPILAAARARTTWIEVAGAAVAGVLIRSPVADRPFATRVT
jgi:hypothetical protein